MDDIIEMNLWQFSIIYALLIVIIIIMKKCKVNKSKLLIVASIRMTVQLTLAGLVLTFIFKNPHPLFTVAYLVCMTAFACFMILSKNKQINSKFKLCVICSLSVVALIIISFFIIVVVGVDFFNARYTIPISGMIIGNAMTGINLALRTFNTDIETQKDKINTLINLGVTPRRILLPFANHALEIAILPTMNNMLGMGIISLPGMMTGQILSGTLPMTAILYQIAIVIALCCVTCLSVFCTLHFGCKTLYNKKNQMFLTNKNNTLKKKTTKKEECGLN